jgi:uncharacterized protein with HEPN domain
MSYNYNSRGRGKRVFIPKPQPEPQPKPQPSSQPKPQHAPQPIPTPNLQTITTPAPNPQGKRVFVPKVQPPTPSTPRPPSIIIPIPTIPVLTTTTTTTTSTTTTTKTTTTTALPLSARSQPNKNQQPTTPLTLSPEDTPIDSGAISEEDSEEEEIIEQGKPLRTTQAFSIVETAIGFLAGYLNTPLSEFVKKERHETRHAAAFCIIQIGEAVIKTGKVFDAKIIKYRWWKLVRNRLAHRNLSWTPWPSIYNELIGTSKKKGKLQIMLDTLDMPIEDVLSYKSTN